MSSSPFLGQPETLCRDISNYERALAIARRLENALVEGEMLNSLGITYIRLNQIARGISYFQQALNLAEQHDYKPLQATILTNLVICCQLLN